MHANTDFLLFLGLALVPRGLFFGTKLDSLFNHRHPGVCWFTCRASMLFLIVWRVCPFALARHDEPRPFQRRGLVVHSLLRGKPPHAFCLFAIVTVVAVWPLWPCGGRGRCHRCGRVVVVAVVTLRPCGRCGRVVVVAVVTVVAVWLCSHSDNVIFAFAGRPRGE